jgi:hypothetical protein
VKKEFIYETAVFAAIRALYYLRLYFLGAYIDAFGEFALPFFYSDDPWRPLLGTAACRTPRG